jgi:hypothetical protein
MVLLRLVQLVGDRAHISCGTVDLTASRIRRN